jgi:hypothetical protein
MQTDAAAIFDDPRLMFYGVEGEMARFVPMTRESYARSIFFDRRLQPAEPQFVHVPLAPLLGRLADAGFAPPRIRFIHHFAHSGSTLLARALDHPGNLVVREPVHLRQLGVGVGAGMDGRLSAEQDRLLEFSLTMLGKRFEPGSTVIVKGNVPISLLAQAIAEADPGQPAILMHFPLDDYCAAVLRTPNHRRWVDAVTAEIGLDQDPLVGPISQLSVAEKAAALWFSMIKRFERLLAAHPAMRSLDANQLFARPADTIAAASGILDAELDGHEAKAVADGPLFSTYSKNPNIPFDNAVRLERRDQARALLADDLRATRRWVERQSGQYAVPEMLDRPLLGESAPLL